MLGTVLPTAASLAATDRYYRSVQRLKSQIADQVLKGTEKRIVGGESRYYLTPIKYAIVNSSGAIRWFDVRPDGDYPAKG